MSNKNHIRSIPSIEVASSSDTNAPVFYFNQYNQSHEYFNNRERIDFVTYEGSLYVPGAERVVPQTNDITKENFVLLVSRGPQGLPGIKGDPGRDGRTPSVFARFDGKQMIFYTIELNEDGTQKINERTGEPVIKRIAATNDLTGPSWRPKRVDDTIVWEKTRDDSQPESINLSDFVKETAPVIFRVDSDNTKRTDETSGPANYIQWKYEGDEYWNNLISISELMNLALAGVCIWFDEDDQEYHLGHRQVLHATYDSSKSGKRIISDVEHGDVLYDAGPIKLHDFSFEIEALGQEICNLQHRVDAIEEELPKFVKAVIINNKLNRPDEDGIVDLGDLDFYTKEESDERFQSKGDYQPAGNYLTPDDLGFELEKDDNGIKLYVTIKGVRKEVGYTCDCKHGDDPVTVPVTGITITNCVSSLKVGNTGTIIWKVSPDNATDKSVSFTSSNTSVATVSSTGVVTAIAAGTAIITVKTTDGNYTATCNVTVTDEDEPTIPTLTINGNGAELITVKVNGTSYTYTKPMQIEEGAIVIISANRTGYEPSYDKNNFEMIKDTSVNITWEEVSHYISVTSVAITNKPSNNTITWDCSNTQTKALGVTVLPSDATNHDSVVWDSSNKNVAIIQGDIQGGDILVKGVGTTIITATGADGKEDRFTLTVKRPEITSFSLNKSVVNLEPEEIETLRIDGTSIIPSCAETGTIDWTSSDPTVATVNSSSGEVTAVFEGTATITARTPNEKTATCTVKVTNSSVQKQYRVRISLDDDEIKVGNTTQAYAILEQSTDGGRTWQETSSSRHPEFNTPDGDGIITVDHSGGLITGAGVGDATVCVYWTDSALWTGELSNCADITVKSAEPVVTPATVTVNFVNPYDGDGIVEVGGTTYEHGDSIEGYNVGDEFEYIASADGYETKTGSHKITEADDILEISLTESIPTTYTASLTPNSSCAPTSYTLTSGSTSIDNASLSDLVDGASVTLTAKRTNYKDIVKTGTVSGQNLVFTIACTEWEEDVPSVISVTGVTIDPAATSITRYCNNGDDSITLTAQINPSNATNKTVTWSVTNPGTVVSITPNGLTCKVEPAQMAGGNATVTVTTEDGNKTASCNITVQDSMIIDIASQETYRLEKNDSYTLTTTTIPSDASITWNSEDPTCVSVNNGVITGLKLGSSNITAKNNVTGCMDNITITVYDDAKPVIRSLNATNISDTEFGVSMTLGIDNGADQTYSVKPLVYAVTSSGNRDTSYLVGSQGDNDEQVDSIGNSDFEYTVSYDEMGNREWIYLRAAMSDNPSNYDEDWVRMPAKEN